MGGEFKWRHFAGELILLCVRWYYKYGISYRDLEEIMGERGVVVDNEQTHWRLLVVRRKVPIGFPAGALA